MARLHNGINGSITGRVGDLIFCIKNGINYVRKVSTNPRKKPSAKQVAQREKFGIVMRFLSPIRGIICESYRTINPKASGLHTAAKQILTEAIIGEYPEQKIDFSKVSLIRGSLARPSLEMTYSEKSDELSLSWPYIMSANAYVNDELYALIYCHSLTQKWEVIPTGVLRSEQNGLIKLPVQLLGREIHVWLTYRSEMMDSFSDSVYLGQIFTKKQDQHESIQ